MNGLVLTTARAMDSREIAKLVGKRHSDVCYDIETQIGKLEGGVRTFAHTYRNEQNGQEYRCFLLPKRETLILVSGYSVELRAKIIDRWEELERNTLGLTEGILGNKIPTSFADALQLAANQARELERTRPLAAVAEQIASADNCLTIKDFAKSLGEGPIKIFGKLKRLGVLYRNSEMDWVPYQRYLDAGYFRTKITTVPHGEKIINHTTALVTGKGEVWLAQKLQEAS